MRKSNLAILVAVLAVSFSAILIRWSDAPALLIALYRLAFTTLLLLPFFILWKRDELRNLGRRELAVMVSIGLVLSAHFILWITSLELTTVASSVILVTAHPILVAGIEHHLFKERLSRINFIGICIAIFGVIVLASGDLDEPGNLWGDFLAWIAGICAGLYILAGRRMRRNVSLITYATLVYLFCFVFLLAACLVAGTALTEYEDGSQMPKNEYLLFFVMALIPGILGHTLYNWSLKHVRASVVSVSLLGEPVGSTLLALILLKETPSSFLVIIGGALTLIGIMMVARRRRKRRRSGHGGQRRPNMINL